MSKFTMVGATASRTVRGDKTFEELVGQDALHLQAEVLAANASLTTAWDNMQTGEVLVQNIEAAMAAAEHIKNVSGDDSVGMVAANASTFIALSSTGISEGDAESMMNGADVGYEAAVASASDIMKNAWETTKKYAKKVWEYIRNLINTVVDYVVGLIGNGGDTGESLKKLLDKLKKDEKTRLNVDKFNEGVQERIAKALPLIGAESSSDVTVSDINDFIDAVKTTIATATSSKPAYSDTEVAKVENVENGVSDNTVKKKFVGKYDASGNDTTWAGIVNTLLNEVANFTGGLQNSAVYKDQIDETIIDAELPSDVAEYVAKVVGYNNAKLVLSVSYVTDDAKEAIGYLKDNKNVDGEAVDGTNGYKNAELTKIVKKIIGGVKTTTVTVEADVSDAISNKENFVPFDFSDCMTVAKKLKDASKKVENDVKKYQKDVDKVLKDIEKAEKTVDKTISKLKDTEEQHRIVREVALEAAIALQKLAQGGYKNTAQGLTMCAGELVNSHTATLVKESARLFSKITKK